MGSLELLKGTKLSEKQTDLLDTVTMSTNVLLMLVEDILELIKIENENGAVVQSSANWRTFNLGECLISLRTMLLGFLSTFEVALNLKLGDGIETTIVESNRSRITQVLSNLITNAVKASKVGGEVNLHCSLEKDGRFKFVVEDFGCGIPKDKITLIFEPFVQLHLNESKMPGYVALFLIFTYPVLGWD